ncbi:MAG: ammonium transporter, partial [Solirubrobacteraceae bacterium]
STIVYFALNYLSRMRPFRNVDDTLGVIYTHGFAGLAGGLLVGIFADPQMALFYKTSKHGLVASGGVAGLIHGNATLLKWQALAALFVIGWTGIVTFALLKLVGLVIPLRMSERNMEIGDTAEHGHEVYPSDVPSLGYPNGAPEPAARAPAPAIAPAHASGQAAPSAI